MCYLEKVRVALARAGAGNGERQLVALSVISILPSPGSVGKGASLCPRYIPDWGRVAHSSIVRICSAEEELGTRSVTWI